MCSGTVIQGINDEEYARKRVQAEVDLAEAVEEEKQARAILKRAETKLEAAQAAAKGKNSDADRDGANAEVEACWDGVDRARALLTSAENARRQEEEKISCEFLGRAQAYRPGMFLEQLGQRIETVADTVRG